MKTTRRSFLTTLFLLGAILVALWLVAGLQVGVHAADLTVCPSGPPACDYDTIQDAVDASAEGDLVKVATGVYTTVNAYGGLAQVVYLDKTVTLRGGYSPDFSVWDPTAYPTTLDAEGNGRVLYITGDPSGQEISPIIEGLQITGGDAAGLGGGPSGNNAGGGLYAITATLTLSDSEVFANNVSGSPTGYAAGLFVTQGQATLVSNVIRDNYLGAMFGSGGGLYANAIDPLVLQNNVFRTNSAPGDAGVAVHGSQVALAGNMIESNTTWGGSTGALALYSCSGEVNGNVIRGNSAPIVGGLLLVSSNLSLANNIIADNTVDRDVSGVSVSDTDVHLIHNTLARNSGGAAIQVANGARVTLTNTILVSHTVGITVTAGSTATLEATLWQGNDTDWGGEGTISIGAISLWDDADFLAPHLGNYHISVDSAALDAGVDAGVYEDIDGDLRPRGAGFDLGADEGPTLPGSVVTTPADSGPGSLRQALLDAVGGNTITFDPAVFPSGNPETIYLLSQLPTLSVDNVTIDASDAGVILDGSLIGTTPETVLVDDVSLSLNGGGDLISNGGFDGSLDHWRAWDQTLEAIRDLTTTDIHSAPSALAWTGEARTRYSQTIYDPSGSSDPFTDWPFYEGSTVWIPVNGGDVVEWRFWYRYGPIGARLRVFLSDGSQWDYGWFYNQQSDWSEAVIERTLDADAVAVAIQLEYHHPEEWNRGLEIHSDGNTVRGLQIVNFPFDGILLSDANSNIIGGDRATGSGPLGQGNLISGNGSQGIQICGESAFNEVLGNYIGTDLSGSTSWPNTAQGVALQCSWGPPHDNTIGGTTPSTRNLISGNSSYGVWLRDGSHHNTVAGNYIGTDASGTTAVGNSNGGVSITGEANRNRIGGDSEDERNVISGNGWHGVRIYGTEVFSNTVSGNYIGVDASGMSALSNGWHGISIGDHARDNIIGGVNSTPGGACTGECNVISANPHTGIMLDYQQVMSTTISGNYIGTDVTGNVALGNNTGVAIGFAARNNVVGGHTPAERNLVGGNIEAGIRLMHADTSSNRVLGNYVGANVSGTGAIPNGSQGVHLEQGARDNLVGGSDPGAGNLIAHNLAPGIGAFDADTLRNTFSRNSMHDNAGRGIALADGANGGLTAPVIANFDLGAGTVSGSACPGCTVEIFSDSGDEGEIYEGQTVATISGIFAFSKGSALAGPNIQATATDPNGNTSEFSTRLPGTCMVTSPADSGGGTLRDCLANAISGDAITFDPAIFAPGSPETIYLLSQLPTLGVDNVTIDASDAGVILHGSLIGTTPETVLVDDVSLSLNGGGDLVSNGGFDDSLDHWRAWDQTLEAIRDLTTTDVHSAPSALAWTGEARTRDSHTIYDPSGSTDPFTDWPFYEGSTVWVPVNGGDAVEWRFWYRYGPIGARLRVLLSDGRQWDYGWFYNRQSDWSEAVIERTLDVDAVAVAIELQYHHPEEWNRGLEIHSDGNTVRGLQIVNFPFDGILLSDANSNIIGGDRATGSGPLGQGNLISGNGSQGIQICGDSAFNEVLGNYIGTDLSGSTSWPNMAQGVALQCSWGPPHDNTIGGTTPSTRNLISGNRSDGISLRDGSHDNVIAGNDIGTDAGGTAPVPNGSQGIWLEGGANNRIGGPTAAERNIITYNKSNGISVRQSGTTGNLIQNNWIGIDADSTGGLDARDLVVADDGTLFMADYGRGVVRSTDGSDSWQVTSNGLVTSEIEVMAVSPDYASDGRVWAWGDGVLYGSDNGGANWSSFNETLPDDIIALEVSPNYGVDGTLLAATGTQGIYRSTDGGLSWTRVYEGSYADCVAFSPNVASDGVVLAGLSWGGILRSTDGGVTWAESNTGLPSLGVYDLAFAADGLTVLAMSDNCSNDGVYRSVDGGQTWTASGIGLEDCGSAWQIAVSPSYGSDGIALALEDGVYRSTDGGQTWSRSGDGAYGSRGHALAFSPAFASDNTAYLANFAGVYRSNDGGRSWDWAGANLADWGNHGRGIEICCGAGATQVLDNVIGRNAWQGISVWDPEAAGTVIDGNLVGLAPDGVTRAGNGSTTVWLETPHVTVSNNTIAAGGHGGVRSNSRAHHLIISGNRIGTDLSGTVAVGNSYDGISLESSWDTVRDNLISGNWGTGIYASESVTSSLFAGNIVGLDATGTRGIAGGLPSSVRSPLLVDEPFLTRAVAADGGLGNAGQGIFVLGSYNIIGGTTSADRNVISGNESWGLGIATGHDNVVVGNYIGTDVSGLNPVGNRGYGLVVYSGAHHNTIGGDTTAAGNVISANDQDGVLFWDAHYNTVRGNYIGTDSTGTRLMGNAWSGIRLGSADSSNNLIGDSNLVAGNDRAGVLISGSNSLHNILTQNSIYANAWLGIELRDGGNTELPAPVITAFDLAGGSASGTACPGCTVELFSDEEGEGRWFEGSTAADGSGGWAFSKGSAFIGPELTATATDAGGNTSEFGQDWPADPPPPPHIAAPLCGVTNQSQPTFSGNAQMGSTVQIGTGGLDLGEALTNDQNRWEVTSLESLADGTYLITATTTTVWGTSGESALDLSVDSTLWYDPVSVAFTQLGVTQHPRDAAGCVNPGAPDPLSLSLWPDHPVTVQVPVGVPGATVYVQVNSITYPLSDPDADWIFTGTFDPGSSANLVIVLVVEVEGSQQIMQIGSTIDPDGYVYDVELTASTGITQTIAGVTVTLEVLDTVRSRWLEWDAWLYDQINPQVTGEEGYFAFFTPPGQYRLVVDGRAQGYALFVSPVLTVVNEPIRFNVPLIAWKEIFLPLVLKQY